MDNDLMMGTTSNNCHTVSGIYHRVSYATDHILNPTASDSKNIIILPAITRRENDTRQVIENVNGYGFEDSPFRVVLIEPRLAVMVLLYFTR